LRNAVDHGIECADERYALGKPAQGTITISAHMAGARIVLEVRDDGQGLDPERIAAAAVKRGIVSKEAAETLSNPERLALLFRDGFSTAQSVSEISGRGVGLAAVREAIEEIGGDYAFDSEGYGEGTSVRLNVPVNVLATRGLLVIIDKVSYVLPVDSVARAMMVSGRDVRTVEGTRVVTPANMEPVPLLWLGSRGQNEKKAAEKQLTVVVVERHDQHVGLVVDEVLEEQEFVTRRLPWNLRRVAGVNGAVVLPSGVVAVSLDVDHLLGASNIQPVRRAAGSGSIRPSGPPSVRPRAPILVVDDSLTSRTLERNILAAAGYEVDVAVDGVEAWNLLQEKQYSLLVADVQMPKMDGLELTQKVRQHPTLQHMPVVLVTSLGKREDIERGAAAGADEYVVKGQLENEKLLLAVERHLYGFGR
jgi:CheY-like chemotaxis protein